MFGRSLKKKRKKSSLRDKKKWRCNKRTNVNSLQPDIRLLNLRTYGSKKNPLIKKIKSIPRSNFSVYIIPAVNTVGKPKGESIVVFHVLLFTFYFFLLKIG